MTSIVIITAKLCVRNRNVNRTKWYMKRYKREMWKNKPVQNLAYHWYGWKISIHFFSAPVCSIGFLVVVTYPNNNYPTSYILNRKILRFLAKEVCEQNCLAKRQWVTLLISLTAILLKTWFVLQFSVKSCPFFENA